MNSINASESNTNGMNIDNNLQTRGISSLSVPQNDPEVILSPMRPGGPTFVATPETFLIHYEEPSLASASSPAEQYPGAIRMRPSEVSTIPLGHSLSSLATTVAEETTTIAAEETTRDTRGSQHHNHAGGRGCNSPSSSEDHLFIGEEDESLEEGLVTLSKCVAASFCISSLAVAAVTLCYFKFAEKTMPAIMGSTGKVSETSLIGGNATSGFSDKQALKMALRELQDEEEKARIQDNKSTSEEKTEDAEAKKMEEEAKKIEDAEALKKTEDDSRTEAWADCADNCGNMCVAFSGLFSMAIWSPAGGFCASEAQIQTSKNWAPHMYWFGVFLMLFVFLKFCYQSRDTLCGCFPDEEDAF